MGDYDTFTALPIYVAMNTYIQWWNDYIYTALGDVPTHWFTTIYMQKTDTHTGEFDTRAHRALNTFVVPHSGNGGLRAFPRLDLVVTYAARLRYNPHSTTWCVLVHW